LKPTIDIPRDFYALKESRAEELPTPNVVAHVIALSELHDTSQGEHLIDGINPLHQIKARLSVCVGEIVLTVGELVKARQGQVLELDRTMEQAVDILLEGRVIARGQLVAVDDHFAVRITELPISLKT
jgi:flagellar motor switch protein FliN/FliY